jgi:hypothetical protein
MPADIEFDFGDPAAPGRVEEEPLEDERAGRWLGRMPQWAWIVAAAVVVGVALVVDLSRGSPSRPIATPSSTASTPLPSVTLPVPSLHQELEAAALDTDPMTNVIRSTPAVYACPAPRQNKLPLAAEFDAIHRAYPAFGRFESGTTLDASAGLCSVNLRARSSDGSILIVRIQAPPNQMMPIVVVEDGSVTGAYPTFTAVDYVSDLGFRVQAGILGTAREPFSSEGIEQLAEDEALLW